MRVIISVLFIIVFIFFLRKEKTYTKGCKNINEYKIDSINEKFKILEVEISIKNIKTKKINSILAITKNEQEKSWFKILFLQYFPTVEIKKCTL